MRKLKLLFVVLAVVLCVFSVPVRAELITIAISGQVTGVSDPSGHFGGQISIGDPIAGTYTYDSSAIDTNPDPAIGDYAWYATPAGISLTIDSFNFRTDPSNVWSTMEVINNDWSGTDYYGLRSYHNLFPLSNGTLSDSILWQLVDSTGTALSSDALPLTVPDLSKWSSSSLLIDSSRGGGFLIGAHITSATLVPEPASVLLFAGGMLFARRLSKKN